MEQHSSPTATQLHSQPFAVLDLTKLLCSFLIVAIHCCPWESVSPALHFGFCDVIARVAVPLFYAITGFLLFGKLEQQNRRVRLNPANFGRIRRYWLRILKLYALWSLICFLWRLPQNYAIGWWGFPMVRDFLVSCFLSGSHYHLWYLLSLLYAIPLLYAITAVVPRRRLPVVFGLLWVVECLVYSYSWLGVGRIPMLNWLLGHFSILFDAAFRAVPLLGVGVLCADSDPVPKKLASLCCPAAFLAVATEATLLHTLTPNDGNYSYLICTPVFTWCLFRFLISRKPSESLQGRAIRCRECSTLIYCIHPLVIDLVDLLPSMHSIIRYVLVATLSVLLALGLRLIRRHRA